MRTATRIAAGVAAATLAGCSGDDDRSFTLVADVAFYKTPISGTFTVSDGSDALGCLRGTFVDNPVGRNPPVQVQWVLTCTNGHRRGSFTIGFFPVTGQGPPPDPSVTTESHWRFERGTGQFTEIDGKGDVTLEQDGDNFSGVATLTGNVAF